MHVCLDAHKQYDYSDHALLFTYAHLSEDCKVMHICSVMTKYYLQTI